MAMVQRPSADTPGAPAGDTRAAVVTGLSFRGAERVVETQITPNARLMSDEAKAFMVLVRVSPSMRPSSTPPANIVATLSTSIR